MESIELKPARAVWYNGGKGFEKLYALVVNVLEGGRLDVLACNANGVWEFHTDVPHVEPADYAGVGDGSGGVTWHHR